MNKKTQSEHELIKGKSKDYFKKNFFFDEDWAPEPQKNIRKLSKPDKPDQRSYKNGRAPS